MRKKMDIFEYREKYIDSVDLPPTSQFAKRFITGIFMLILFVVFMVVLTISFAMISSTSTIGVILGNVFLFLGFFGFGVGEYFLVKQLIGKEKNEDSNH